MPCVRRSLSSFATLHAFVIAIAVAAGVPPALGQNNPLSKREVLVTAKPSIANLIARKDGVETRATGFVIARPGDGKKLILTAGHIFRNDMTLSARLPGMRDHRPCRLVSYNPKYDLMVVEAEDEIAADALKLLENDDPAPENAEEILVIGCPGGLSEDFQPGMISADSISASDLNNLLFGKAQRNQLTTPFGETTLLRHNAFSFPGMSGGPILNQNGRVVAVHLGILPNASNVCFGVHVKHVGDLKLFADPKEFKGISLSSEIGHVLTIRPADDAPPRPAPPPLLLKFDDEEIDANCAHYGYVDKNADLVIDRYIQDAERFRNFFGVERMQALLDDIPVAHITNTALGFRILVPKGYSYEMNTNVPKTGVFVTFRTPDADEPDEFRKVTVLAYVDTVTRKLCLDEAIEEFTSGKKPLPDDLQDTFQDRLLWINFLTDNKMVSKAADVYVDNTLQLQLVDSEGKKYGDPNRPLFTIPLPLVSADRQSYWRRYNYDSVDGDISHSVRYLVRGDLVLITHYQFLKKDRDNFVKNEEFSRRFLERMFISSTVSLY